MTQYANTCFIFALPNLFFILKVLPLFIFFLSPFLHSLLLYLHQVFPHIWVFLPFFDQTPHILFDVSNHFLLHWTYLGSNQWAVKSEPNPRFLLQNLLLNKFLLLFFIHFLTFRFFCLDFLRNILLFFSALILCLIYKTTFTIVAFLQDLPPQHFPHTVLFPYKIHHRV